MDKIEELKIEIPQRKTKFSQGSENSDKRENDEEETLNPNKSKTLNTTQLIIFTEVRDLQHLVNQLKLK